MIVDPPVIALRAKLPRPEKRFVPAFAGVPTGNVIDAVGGSGALNFRIKPLEPSSKVMFGVALTCNAGPGDNFALFGAISIAEPGAAVIRDLMAGMARNRGVAGLVTDRLVRDVAGILSVGPPVYCADVSPNPTAYNDPGTVGEPVDLGGLRIESGDILIGDRDGVVVPRGCAAAILEARADVRAAEAALETKIRAGLEIPDSVQAVLDSDRVSRID